MAGFIQRIGHEMGLGAMEHEAIFLAYLSKTFVPTTMHKMSLIPNN